MFNKGNKLINAETRVFKYINSCFPPHFMNLVHICHTDYIKIRTRKDDTGLKKIKIEIFFSDTQKIFSQTYGQSCVNQHNYNTYASLIKRENLLFILTDLMHGKHLGGNMRINLRY